MDIGICVVRHRIDGLENADPFQRRGVFVRHRIDGLENDAKTCRAIIRVRHRIDGLEKFQANMSGC